MDRSWYAVTETCLAFTVFRDDVSPSFLALFTTLLFLKAFHWLAEERVDFVSTTLNFWKSCQRMMILKGNELFLDGEEPSDFANFPSQINM